MKPYALNIEKRKAALGKNFRFGKRSEHLAPFRTEYHLDRDDIVWCKAFKRLQHKTQVFPHYLQDYYKRRLTHSLEVATIASSLARALELNEVATEAIALGHDIGHTPFGHAGEKALNDALKYLGTKDVFKDFASSKKLPLFGFDHCVHAVEILTRIETRQYQDGDTHGLDLTFDVVDGILKHIYGEPKEGHPFATMDAITSYSDFNIFGNNKGSLEAQCVWFADKLAYLMGDIEDGFNSKILSIQNIYEAIEKAIETDETGNAKDFKKSIEVYINWGMGIKDYKNITLNLIPYIRNRGIDLLVDYAFRNAQGKIKEKNVYSIEDVFVCGERIVHVAKHWSEWWSWFYKNIVTNLLFNHKDVYAFNMKCEHIVKKLFMNYYHHPELIPIKYRDRTGNTYKNITNNKNIIRVIQARNYVAGMTDPYAILQYNRLFVASEPIIPDIE